jgi:hypothetical protein
MQPKRKRLIAGSLIFAIAAGSAGLASSASGSSSPSVASKIDPADFTSKVDNPFLPWKPGTHFHYKASQPGTRNPVAVTHRTTKIAGVKCVVVRDIVTHNGTPVERSLDWYAQDKHGNVWYFGEASSVFKHGHFAHNASDSWKTGVHGATPGILMEAHPRKGDVYRQEQAPNSKDRAKVLGYVDTMTVPFGTFHHVLETKEFTPLEPSIDHDFYARGIGEIQEINVKGGEGKTKLVSITH